MGWRARVVLVPSPGNHQQQQRLDGSANGRQFNSIQSFPLLFLFLSLCLMSFTSSSFSLGQYSVVALFLSVSQHSLIHSFIIIMIWIICSTAWTRTRLSRIIMNSTLGKFPTNSHGTWIQFKIHRRISSQGTSAAVTIWLKSTDRFHLQSFTGHELFTLHLLLNNGINRGITTTLTESFHAGIHLIPSWRGRISFTEIHWAKVNSSRCSWHFLITTTH